MMERIEAYRWRGTIYTRDDAVRAVNEAIGEIICRHARALAAIDKYVATADYLESNVADFAKIAELQEDLAIIERGGAE